MTTRRIPLLVVASAAAAGAFVAGGGPTGAGRGSIGVGGPRAEAAAARPPAYMRHPDGAAMVRVLGSQAARAFAPASGSIGALVAIPPGQTAAALGVEEVVPGIGRLRGTPSKLLAFADAHPGVHTEVSPPLHPLMPQAKVWIRAYDAQSAGADGAGTLVGVADTGIDVKHQELRDANGKTRIAWLLDLSLQPLGIYPDLEDKFGVKDDKGNLVAGAVLAGSDIDGLIARSTTLPTDEVGHGTHVASIAAGDGDDLGKKTPYGGVAPAAGVVIARVARSGTEAIENDDLLRGVQFLFDRADAEKKPIAVNVSLGGDFGPHDGTTLWEQALAGLVGSEHPGRALVVAAGNSGDVADLPIHQTVRVTDGTTFRVPVLTNGADDGGVDVWVAFRAGASMKVGLDGPDGNWIAPQGVGEQRGKHGDTYDAGVIAEGAQGSPITEGSHGAVVLWQGKWPSGAYYVTLEGEGTADLFMQATGDVLSTHPAAFAAGVREGTINLPATHPSIIAVGCTMNRTRWDSIAGGPVAVHVPVLDAAGGLADETQPSREATSGEVCWFSSAGPTLTGVPKPELSAPGGSVAAAMSDQAKPGVPTSIFTTPNCPPVREGRAPDPRCFQIDATHAVALGTSMSSPMVAGAAALLFQRDPTLTQDVVRALLQAGAHRFRGSAPFQDQAGPGELDVVGALATLDQMKGSANGAAFLPSAKKSWITLSSDYAAADGSTPVTAILELRTSDGAGRADLFDSSRLVPRVTLGRDALPTPAVERRGPGLFAYTVDVPRGSGGQTMTFGATFDGADVVAPRAIPVAADPWLGAYPVEAKGGCSAAARASDRGGCPAALGGIAAVAAAAAARRRRRRRAS